MPFLGTTPLQGFVSSVEKQSITNANGVLTDFTLTHPVANENDLEVFVGNVRQEPGVGKSYTAAGTTLSMSEAPAAGVNFYIIYKNQAQVTTTPPDGSVGMEKLSATGTKDTTTFLRGDNSFQSVTPLIFEGSTVDDYETIVTATDAKLSDKTLKLPSANGTLGMVAVARQAWNNNSQNYLDFTNLPDDYDSFLFDIRALASANDKEFAAQFIAESNNLIIDGNNYDYQYQMVYYTGATTAATALHASDGSTGAAYMKIANNVGSWASGQFPGAGMRIQVVFSGRNWRASNSGAGSSLDTMPSLNWKGNYAGNGATVPTAEFMIQNDGAGRLRRTNNGQGTNTNSFVNVNGVRFYFPTTTIRTVEAACYGLFPSHHS